MSAPDLYELAIKDRPGETRWVLSGADGEYLLGAFDGHVFTPESTGKQRLWHGDGYAGQTFSDVPDGRRIHVAWGRGIVFPGMPFNQQMTIPCESTLREDAEGLSLRAAPIAELERLMKVSHACDQSSLKANGETRISAVGSDFFRVKVEAEVGDEGSLTLKVRGVLIVIDRAAGTLSVAKVVAPYPSNGLSVKLDVLVDRGSIEVFADDGRVAVSAASLQAEGEDQRIVSLSVTGDRSLKQIFSVDELKSSW